MQITDGAMQPFALTLDKFLEHAAKWHPHAEVVTGREGGRVDRIGYDELDPFIASSELQANRAFERELERVRKQVEYDLFPKIRIDEERIGASRRVDVVLETRALDRSTEVARDVAREYGESERFECRGHPPSPRPAHRSR